MPELETATIVCPYCWQAYEISVDCSTGAREYVEDCEVCCHPIRVRLRLEETGALLGVETEREND